MKEKGNVSCDLNVLNSTLNTLKEKQQKYHWTVPILQYNITPSPFFTSRKDLNKPNCIHSWVKYDEKHMVTVAV